MITAMVAESACIRVIATVAHLGIGLCAITCGEANVAILGGEAHVAQMTTACARTTVAHLSIGGCAAAGGEGDMSASGETHRAALARIDARGICTAIAHLGVGVVAA